MAYNTITDTRIAVGKPGDNNLFTDLRDNPIGIANGDTGAPPVQSKAIACSVQSSGLQSVIASGAAWTPSAGIYNFRIGVVTGMIFEIFVSGAWRSNALSQNVYCFFCDGTNMRFRNPGAPGQPAASIYYQKMCN